MENTNLQQSKKGGVLPLILGIAALVFTFAAIIIYFIGQLLAFPGDVKMVVPIIAGRLLPFIIAFVMPVLVLVFGRKANRNVALVLAIVNVVFLLVQMLAAVLVAILVSTGHQVSIFGQINGSNLFSNLYAIVRMLGSGYVGRSIIMSILFATSAGCFALKHLVCALAFVLKAFKKK